MGYSQSPKPDAPHLQPRKSPSQSRSQKTFDYILEGAAHILEEQEFEGYTTNAIAERAGVSIGSLYQYFPGRDAVTVALIEQVTAGLIADVEKALTLPDAHAALRATIMAAVRHQLRRPRLARSLDFEERRLASAMPPSRSAQLIQRALARFLDETHGWHVSDPADAATDIIAMASALTDAAGRRDAIDPAALAQRIEGATIGYLSAGHPPDSITESPH